MRLRPLAAALSFVAVALVGCEGGALERPPDVGGRDARPNVIVYLIDTLRADHLGIYGYPRPTSPHIDEFAVGGTVFDRAIAQDSKTLGSVASLLTSLHTQSHGLTRFGHKLGPGVVTLAQTMRDAGYQTGAFITNVNAGELSGLDQGFGHFYDATKTWRDREALRSLPDDAVFRWLDRIGQSPFFAYIHTAEPHRPYIPPPPYDAMFDANYAGSTTGFYRGRNGFSRAEHIADIEHVKALYDGEIRYADEAVGRLLDELERRDLLGRTIVILTSDHGEELYDRGHWNHGHTLYNELIQVPLIFSGPAISARKRISTPVQLVDVAPTILELAQISSPEEFEGASLLELIGGEKLEAFSQRPVYAMTTATPHQVAVVRGSWKAILWPGGTLELFDLARDPKEQNNLVDEESELEIEFRSLIDGWMSGHVNESNRSEVPLTEEAQERLRALGYIE